PRQPLLRQIRMVPRINNRFVPDADAIVATAWPTAHSISRLSPSKGAKCYIVQHREIDSGLPEDVDATYRLPLFRIAGSEYTARLLREEVGVEAEAVVRNGIDVSFWSRGSLPRPARSGVLMPHAPGERKGARFLPGTVKEWPEACSRWPGLPISRAAWGKGAAAGPRGSTCPAAARSFGRARGEAAKRGGEAPDAPRGGALSPGGPDTSRTP